MCDDPKGGKTGAIELLRRVFESFLHRKLAKASQAEEQGRGVENPGVKSDWAFNRRGNSPASPVATLPDLLATKTINELPKGGLLGKPSFRLGL
jgi:hypothetical protein